MGILTAQCQHLLGLSEPPDGVLTAQCQHCQNLLGLSEPPHGDSDRPMSAPPRYVWATTWGFWQPNVSTVRISCLSHNMGIDSPMSAPSRYVWATHIGILTAQCQHILGMFEPQHGDSDSPMSAFSESPMPTWATTWRFWQLNVRIVRIS